VSPDATAPRVVSSRAPGIVLAGLELLYATPELPTEAPPAPPPKSPTPAKPAARSLATAVPPPRAADATVDSTVQHPPETAENSPNGAIGAAMGAPVSAGAKHALDAIARSVGMDPAELARVANSPHDQALFLVQRLFDPHDGEAVVRARYGTAGALAAESLRRMRDLYRVTDLNAEQRENLLVVVETALIVGGALGQVDNPDFEMVDVDPGAGADRGRFEQAIAANRAIARCVRPTGRPGDRVYVVEIPRHGPGRGEAICANAWAIATDTIGRPSRALGNTDAVVPPLSAATAVRAPSITTELLTSPAAAGIGPSTTIAPLRGAPSLTGLGSSIATVPSTAGGAVRSIVSAPLASIGRSSGAAPLPSMVSGGPLGLLGARATVR